MWYNLGQGLKNIWRNKLFSLASIATMSACIFLFGVFYSIGVNFSEMVQTAEEGVAVTPETFGMDAMTRGCLGGTGFCFISHTGQVQPCGYLELNCGNVRETPFPEIWRTSKYFRQFRDQKCYEGKCGVCEFHKVCGGCRARAWSMNGNHMAEEPLCTYQPKRATGAK